MNGTLTAKRLRVILLVAIVIVIAAVSGGFLFAQNSLLGYAKTISQLNADAETGDQSIATLKQLEARLDDEQAVIEAAHSIVGDSSSFADTVVSDVTRIASESGVAITSFEFVDSATTPAANGTTTTPAPAAATPPATTTPTPAGVTLKSISVTLASPLSYDKLMTFIKKIESNKPKLQIANVSLTKGEKGMVSTQSFSIGAYVR